MDYDDPDRRARIRVLSELWLTDIRTDDEGFADLAVLILSRLPLSVRQATLRRAIDELVEVESRPVAPEMKAFERQQR